MASDATQFRRDFWTRYAELYPDDGVTPGWGRSHARIAVEAADLHVSLAVLGWGVGVWLRGKQGEPANAAAARLGQFKESFQSILTDTFGEGAGFQPGTEPGTEWINATGGFDACREFDVDDPENWQHMAAWLHYMLHIYLRVIEKAQVAAQG